MDPLDALMEALDPDFEEFDLHGGTSGRVKSVKRQVKKWKKVTLLEATTAESLEEAYFSGVIEKNELVDGSRGNYQKLTVSDGENRVFIYAFKHEVKRHARMLIVRNVIVAARLRKYRSSEKGFLLDWEGQIINIGRVDKHHICFRRRHGLLCLQIKMNMDTFCKKCLNDSSKNKMKKKQEMTSYLAVGERIKQLGVRNRKIIEKKRKKKRKSFTYTKTDHVVPSAHEKRGDLFRNRSVERHHGDAHSKQNTVEPSTSSKMSLKARLWIKNQRRR